MNSATTLIKEVGQFFPTEYALARCAWLSAVTRLEWPTETASWPLDEMLSTESVWIGSPNATSVLILISGTHGVEGPVGTAIQLDLLSRLGLGQSLPSNTALLLVFALNPFGYAHDRRCDSDGIDLNRNFVDFSQPLPPNSGYEAIRETLYLDDIVERSQRLEAYRRAHDARTYEIAISGGQYSDPYGPFFGGVAPAHGNRVIEKLIKRYDLTSRHVAVVDLHSGLGPYGHGELICDHPSASNGFRVAQQWYGASVASPERGDSSSVPKLGLLDYRWHALMARAGCFVTLEFGTYPVQTLFKVILEDHRSWKCGNSRAKEASAIAMRAHFCPADEAWRELVLLKGRQVIQQALKGVSE